MKNLIKLKTKLEEEYYMSDVLTYFLAKFSQLRRQKLERRSRQTEDPESILQEL